MTGLLDGLVQTSNQVSWLSTNRWFFEQFSFQVCIYWSLCLQETLPILKLAIWGTGLHIVDLFTLSFSTDLIIGSETSVTRWIKFKMLESVCLCDVMITKTNITTSNIWIWFIAFNDVRYWREWILQLFVIESTVWHYCFDSFPYTWANFWYL